MTDIWTSSLKKHKQYNKGIKDREKEQFFNWDISNICWYLKSLQSLLLLVS